MTLGIGLILFASGLFNLVKVGESVDSLVDHVKVWHNAMHLIGNILVALLGFTFLMLWLTGDTGAILFK